MAVRFSEPSLDSERHTRATPTDGAGGHEYDRPAEVSHHAGWFRNLRADRPVPHHGGARAGKAVARLVADGALAHAGVGLLARALPSARVELTWRDIVVPCLPAALDGLRLLHLSDLHLRPSSSVSHRVDLSPTAMDRCPVAARHHNRLFPEHCPSRRELRRRVVPQPLSLRTIRVIGII